MSDETARIVARDFAIQPALAFDECLGLDTVKSTTACRE